MPRGRPKKQDTSKFEESISGEQDKESGIKTDIEIKPADAHQATLKKASDSKDEYNIEVIKDYYGAIDPFYLSQKDPEYEYRFLRDEQKNINIKTSNLLHFKGGWQIVPREHLIRLGLEKEISADGLCRRGDTILARMPKKLFQEKEEYKRRQANEPMDAIKRFLKEGDPTKGGKEIHESMKGIQTEKALGFK